MNLKRLTDGLPMPSRATENSAGYDLCSAIDTQIPPSHRAVIPTGFAWEFWPSHCGQIWPRSGIAARCGIDVMAGLIDPDYRGEICVVLINHGTDVFRIKKGDRIAQLVLTPFHATELFEGELTETIRGAGGFGSTGEK